MKFTYSKVNLLLVSTFIVLVQLSSSFAIAQEVGSNGLRKSLRLIELIDLTKVEKYQLTFTKNSKLFLTTRDKLTKLWTYRVENSKKDFRPCDDNKDSPIDLYKVGTNVNNGGNILAFGCEDFSVEIWNLESTKRTARFQVQKSKNSESLDPYIRNDGKRVLLKTSGIGEHAELWDSETGRKVADLTSEATICPTCNRTVYFANGFSPNGKIVAVSFGAMVFLWDAETGKLLHRLIDENAKLYGDAVLSHKAAVSVLIFSKDSKTVFTAAGDGTTKSWDTETGKLLTTFKKHSYEIENLALSPDEKVLATASAWDDFQLWDVKTGSLIWNSPDMGKDVKFVSFSPDGKKILSRTNSKFTIWDVATGKPLEQMPVTEELFPNFSPDWRLVTWYDRKNKSMGLYEYLGK